MMSEWWNNPLIQEIDSFVESHFDKQCIDDYFNQFDAVHIADWKNEMSHWIEDRRSLWDSLQEMIDALPDDENEEYHSLDSTLKEEQKC